MRAASELGRCPGMAPNLIHACSFPHTFHDPTWFQAAARMCRGPDSLCRSSLKLPIRPRVEWYQLISPDSTCFTGDRKVQAASSKLYQDQATAFQYLTSQIAAIHFFSMKFPWHPVAQRRAVAVADCGWRGGAEPWPLCPWPSRSDPARCDANSTMDWSKNDTLPSSGPWRCWPDHDRSISLKYLNETFWKRRSFLDWDMLRCPKLWGIPSKHPCYFSESSILNHPAIGVPPFHQARRQAWHPRTSEWPEM